MPPFDKTSDSPRGRFNDANPDVKSVNVAFFIEMVCALGGSPTRVPVVKLDHLVCGALDVLYFQSPLSENPDSLRGVLLRRWRAFSEFVISTYTLTDGHYNRALIN